MSDATEARFRSHELHLSPVQEARQGATQAQYSISSIVKTSAPKELGEVMMKA